MTILLLGCNGQLGWELGRALAPLGEVVALAREGRDTLCGDLERPDDLRRTVRRLEPRLIVNAAAYTAVDAAESEPERARLVNVDAPAVLATEAERLDAWLVHYSTDYVFDGSGRAPWSENDAPAPLGVYGETKWSGEQAVRETGCRHLIFRTQWLYSARGENFITTVLRSAAERDTLHVADDQTGAPTGAELVADATAHALRSAAARPSLAGTYHLAARGEVTRHGCACFVVEAARRAGWPIRVKSDAIVPVRTQELTAPARRPRNSRLSVDRLERDFGLRLPDWRPGVRRALAQMCGRTSPS